MDERSDSRAQRVLHQTQSVSDDIRALGDELRAAGRELADKIDIRESVRAHPIRSVLIGAGIGYVLGGGLVSRATMALVAIGAKAVLVPLAKAQLAELMMPREPQPH